MSYRVMAPEFETLVDRNEPIQTVAGGFIFTEGPIWHPTGQYLLFSDMPGDVRRRWDAEGGVREVRRPANKCNGMTYDADLNLIVCEHATSSLIRETPAGGREVLASHFEGKELNSPNDVCVRSDGSIYFSDPWYGRMPGYGVERDRQLGWQGVFRLAPDGKLHLVVPRHDFVMPNGLCFSPDEKLLYINDSEGGLIRVYEVAANGALRRGRIFAEGMISQKEAGVPDGMKCDERGNIWCTGPGGVWVFSPKAELLGRIAVPEVVGNLHWGGPISRRCSWRRAPPSTAFAPRSARVRALHAQAARSRRRRPGRGEARERARGRGWGSGARPGPLRPHHPGSAERRDQRGRCLRKLRRPRPCHPAEHRPECEPPRAGLPLPWHPRDSRLVRGRSRRAGHDAERPSLPERSGQRGDDLRQLGAAPVAGLEPEPGDFVVEKCA